MKKHLHKIYAALTALSVFVAFVLFYPAPTYASTTVQFTANGTFTVPAGVTSLQVSAWAGAGSGGASGGGGGGGGGGGAYSGLNSFSVTPGNVYTVVVGQGGLGVTNAVGNAGGDSMFSASSTLLAKGGGPGPQGHAAGGPGGASASGVGDVVHSGGNGGIGNNVSGVGGGGGGGAGTLNDGGVGGGIGNGFIGGIGGSVGGGNGSAGTGGNTLAGNTLAGASGGAFGTSGTGARGEVDITYTAAAPTSHATVTISSGKTTITSGTVIIP